MVAGQHRIRLDGQRLLEISNRLVHPPFFEKNGAKVVVKVQSPKSKVQSACTGVFILVLVVLVIESGYKIEDEDEKENEDDLNQLEIGICPLAI